MKKCDISGCAKRARFRVCTRFSTVVTEYPEPKTGNTMIAQVQEFFSYFCADHSRSHLDQLLGLAERINLYYEKADETS